MRVLILIIVLSGLMPHSIALSAPDAAGGVMDLRGTPLAAEGPVDLKGEWHFQWRQFVSKQTQAPTDPPQLLRAPATWGTQKLDDHGYGTYSLRLLLSEEDVGRDLALRLPSIASAYVFYLNGERAASAGTIGTGSEMAPEAKPQLFYFHVEQPEVELLLHVSNYSQRKGGMWDAIRLGTAEQITAERERRTMFQLFVSTGLLLIGVYQLGYFFVLREKSTLYFGLACLGLFLRSLFVGDRLGGGYLPFLSWESSVKIEYLSVFWGVSFLVLYFYHLYVEVQSRTLSYGLAALMFVATLPVLLFPANAYTEGMYVYQWIVLALAVYIVYMLARAARFRQPGAVMNLAIGSLFLAAVLNDILYYSFFLPTVDLVSLGLFLFLFTQMFMIARKFALAYRLAERMKKEVEHVNGNLERIVEERTRALQVANEQLKRSEQARKELLSSITHELANPLTTMIGYMRRVKEGTSREVERHIGIAYRKSLSLERLLNDLRQLSLLENAKLESDKQPVRLERLYRALAASYDWEVLDFQVELQFDDPDRVGPYTVQIDLARIEQVFANMVNNAFAHVQPGGRIRIAGRLFPYAQACAISVQDDGVGIRKEEQALIFDRFYRVGQYEERRSNGTGLGLAISKAIVETHEGKIGVRSEYGRGSTFYFILPAQREEGK